MSHQPNHQRLGEMYEDFGSGDSDAAAAARARTAEQRRKVYDRYSNSLRHQGLYQLAGEIDRCLKKVSEGVETFEDTWQKVHNATNANQKEKYETDLKREIKKLQRFRDQIKSWIACGEIKDKSTLVDARKLIETQMERFKVVERETKTKAYSKEGLGAAQKLDPTTREREDLNNWLISSIDQIRIQMDQMECEIESTMAGKKKKLDKDKQERMDELKVSMDRHGFHMGKLETILRMLDNLSVDVNALRKFLSQVKKIKEDIEYYLESNQEPEYEENEFLYDDIEGLEEFDDGIAQLNALTNLALNATREEELGETPTSNTSENNSTVSTIHSRDSSSDPGKRRKSFDDFSKVVRPVAMKTYYGPSPASKGVGCASKAPLSKGSCTVNSNTSASEGASISAAHGLKTENGETTGEHSSSHQKLKSTDNITASVGVLGENGLFSSIFQDGRSLLDCNQLSSVAVGSGSRNITSKTDLSLRQPFTQPFPTGLGTNSQQSNSHSSAFSQQQPTYGVFGTPGAVGLAAAGMSNFNSVVLGGTSSNVMGRASMLNHNSGGGASVTALSSSNSPWIMTTTATSLAPGGAVSGNSRDGGRPFSLLGSSSGVQSSSHRNSSWDNLPSQQQQQLQQLQMQGSGGQTGSSLDTTPISHYMRKQDQILLNRILQEGGDAMASAKTMAQDALDCTGLNLGLGESSTNVPESKTQSAYIPPLLGVAPLGHVPLSKEHQYQFQMLESAHRHMPIPADAERMRQFLPRNPIPTPAYYLQHPMAIADSMEFFQRLSIETLFFIFYYLEGTKAQYMAAKVLKKQSWRFHTKYMMWFQRHEEPKLINEEFEQGTYIYFDIEKWTQRKKDGFVFEYKYLEDKDLC